MYNHAICVQSYKAVIEIKYCLGKLQVLSSDQNDFLYKTTYLYPFIVYKRRK